MAEKGGRYLKAFSEETTSKKPLIGGAEEGQGGKTVKGKSDAIREKGAA